jgi:ubiquinone/menaquinone biosynthesis C-methylase UbiE
MPFEFKNLGLDKNVEVLRRQVNVANRQVVDIGCGSMTFSKILAGEGASVLAIDPDSKQAAINRGLDEFPQGIVFEEAGASAIPADDGSQDGAFFSYSLHHIAASLYDDVFAEVDRVLRDDGFVYVIEPVGGPLNDVMKLFHNEEAERAAAWQALEAYAKQFDLFDAFQYHSIVEFENWEAFVDRYGNRSFNPDYTVDDVRRTEVKAAFEKFGTETETGIQFPSNKCAVCLRRN